MLMHSMVHTAMELSPTQLDMLAIPMLLVMLAMLVLDTLDSVLLARDLLMPMLMLK